MLNGGCDLINNPSRVLSRELSVWPAWIAISVHKVRNLRCEQKDLERSAKDGDSPVCQASQALYLSVGLCE